MDTKQLLIDRGRDYGDFANNAALSQELKTVARSHCKAQVSALHLEALDMIFLKISRILTGSNPNYADSWDDIAGYAKLVADRVRT